MDARELSFTELDRRIRALPEGPVAALNPPRWLTLPTVLGTVGMVVGLMPSLLVLHLEPKMWMVHMQHVGLWMMLLGWAPSILRSVIVLATSMRRWRSEQVEQLDHDLGQLRALQAWLVRQQGDVLAEHLRYVQFAQARMAAKLGVLAGGLEKLGVLPLLVALAIQLKAYADWENIPQWQVILGLFAAVTYLIGFLGTLMRQRLQLYEAVLSEALQRKGQPA